MRIARLIGKPMMSSMCRDPEDGTPFQSERRANGHRVFQPLWCLVPTMGEQAVVAHSNAEPSRDPPQCYGKREAGPGEIEQGHDRQDMEQGHEGYREPVRPFDAG